MMDYIKNATIDQNVWALLKSVPEKDLKDTILDEENFQKLFAIFKADLGDILKLP